MSKKEKEQGQPTRARLNWERYEYLKSRGHTDYIGDANELDGMYMGAGEQWRREDRVIVEEEERPCEEINLILPAINAALGYQISNRLDVTFRPRGRGADEEIAKTLSKVAMQVADNNRFKWVETQVFADGLICRRGYFEIRIDFDDSMLGEIRITDLDPRDVAPDCDGKSYDPDHWHDVTITRWMSADEVEAWYGLEARKRLENGGDAPTEGTSFEEDDSDRPRFGNERGAPMFDSYIEGRSVDVPRWRIIDRQYWRMVPSLVGISPTGDIRVLDENDMAKRDEMAKAGWIITRRPTRRVHWLVTTYNTVLFDDLSPYKHFTVVPFFPFFRRGKTRGLVDNAVSPQRVLNKSVSQATSIINETANSGWIVEQGSLVNMRPDDLETRGAGGGLVLVVRKSAKFKPEKIKPNPMPDGMDKLIALSISNLRSVTLNEALLGGEETSDQSGIALQSRQFVAQQQLAVPLDNLSRTRHMLWSRGLCLLQTFYDDPRIIRITESDPFGREKTEDVAINQPDGNGGWLNDLTVGEYDVVISETPMQITFDNGQFTQVMEMRGMANPVNIPDSYVIRYSNLQDKGELLDAIEAQGQQSDPLNEAKALLAKAQAEFVKAQAVAKRVETMFSASETAQNIAALPQVAPLADEVLLSAGFEDSNAPPLLPVAGTGVLGGMEQGIGVIPEPPRNTNPLTPRNPAVGMNEGIEGGGDGL